MKRAYTFLVAALSLLLLSPAVSTRGSAAVNEGSVSDFSFITTNMNGIEYAYDEGSGVYTFVTQNGDPFVFTSSLETTLPLDSNTLTFEYTSTAEISNFQIFFANAAVGPSEASSLTDLVIEETGEDEWKTFTLNVSSYRMTHAWGMQSDYMRFDFGTQAGVTVKVRNVHLGAAENGGEEPVDDYRNLLTQVVDSIYDQQFSFVVGTTPGFISSQEALTAYEDGLQAAVDLMDDANATQDELKAGVEAARKVIADAFASIVPIADGNYFIETADPTFAEKQPGITYAWLQAQGSDNLQWAKLDENNTGYYFNIHKLDNGRYLFQSLKDNRFVGYGMGDARASVVNVAFTTDSVEQILTPVGDGTYYISAAFNPLCYLHAIGHSEGAGVSGTVMPASTKDVPELWKVAAADTSNFPQMRDIEQRTVRANALNDSIAEAESKSFEVKAPAGLITDASQLSSNCQWNATYAYSNLIDGDHKTHFHSPATGVSVYTSDEWLQADLGRDDISQIILEFWGRNDGTEAQGWHDTPNNIGVKVSNTPDDDSSWTEVATFTSGFPGNYNNGHYVSPVINMGGSYRYVRMYVRGTTSGNPYWNISEYQLYKSPVEASEGSLYNKVPEIKTATDQLDAALDVAKDHIANLSVDGTEMTAINEALDAIKAIENQTERVQAIVTSANSLYASLFVSAYDPSNALITEVNTKGDGTNQLSSNCTWTTITSENDNYSFNAEFIEDNYNLLGALIDNNDQTYWHSDPNSFNVNSQIGYLQIDLKRSDVKNYSFMFYRRHDFYTPEQRYRVGTMPQSIDVYATNDESVGTDVSSDISSWTKIATVNDIPDENTADVWPYYTDGVSDGTAYRYLRVRLYNSSAAYVSFSGFNVFNADAGIDQEASQYYAVEGMKDAADKMSALAASVQAKIDAGTATITDGTELQEAIDAVQALYQDRTGLESLVAKAEDILDNYVEGDEMGQLSDVSTLTPLQTAVDAAKAPATSSTTEFNTRRDNLQSAYDAVIDAIVQPVPGKWYYILSNTAEGDASGADGYYGVARQEVRGAALYVLSNGGVANKGDKEGEYTTTQLRWGMDDIKGKAREGDVDAIWRFVAAPDSFGKRTYYIQNLRTGYYVGECNTVGGDYYYYQEDSTYVPFRLDYIGSESFNLVPLAGGRENIPISFGDNARQVRGNDIAQTPGNRASLTFEEFDTEENYDINIDFFNDSARIVTLPFAVSDLGRNEDVRAYSIHSVVKNDEGQGIGLGLTQKDEFAAGEPFILVVGDTTKHTSESGYKTLTFTTPAADAMLTELVADTVNGLIGTFPRTVSYTEANHDYLFLRGTSLRINSPAFLDTTKYTGYTIYAHTGYIDPVRIVDQEGEPDVVMYTPQGTFSTEIVNAIKSAKAVEADAKVSVYTIDGALVRRNVNAAEAAKGLRKGLYIIGKEKVLVK